ncbi:hypothetical protein QT15_10945 [Pseudoalteromonas flavipulchra NCIMB 2033 = ATCC BAA-314]|nr:hypothetical protein QT15_10945 [Pseudoalteromonas flavipulchra NCIMB 2033 = ATCC BAA-314]
MISKLDKTIFIHIPKTGGQGIERVFLRRVNLDWNGANDFCSKNHNPKSEPRGWRILLLVSILTKGIFLKNNDESSSNLPLLGILGKEFGLNIVTASMIVVLMTSC